MPDSNQNIQETPQIKATNVENITTKITKAKNVNNPGQMGLNPDSFHRLKKKL